MMRAAPPGTAAFVGLRRSPVVWPAAVLAASLGLRMLTIENSGASLHVDEAQYWDWSRSLQWGYYSKPPLIAALIAWSTALFGDGEVGVRFFAQCCWTAAGAVVAALAYSIAAATYTPERRPAEDPLASRAALWAAVLFAVSPLNALLGLVATTDGPLVLAWASALMGLWMALQQQRPLGWLLFTVSLTLGLLDKYTVLAILPGAAWWCWRSAGPRRGGVPLAMCCAVAATLLLPHGLWNASHGWPTVQHTADITWRAASALDGPMGLALFVGGQLLVAGPLVWWAALRALRRSPPASAGNEKDPGARQRRASAISLMLASALPLLLVGAWQGWQGRAGLNWMAPAHLSLIVFAAWQLARPVRRPGPWAAAAILQCLLLVALVLLPPLMVSSWPVAARWDPLARMRGWPEAFEAMARERPAGPLLVLSDSRTLLAQAAYHGRASAFERAAVAVEGRPRHHYEMACPWTPGLAGGRDLWLLTEGPPSPALLAKLPPMQAWMQWPVRRLDGSTGTVIHAWRLQGAPLAGRPRQGACR